MILSPLVFSCGAKLQRNPGLSLIATGAATKVDHALSTHIGPSTFIERDPLYCITLLPNLISGDK